MLFSQSVSLIVLLAPLALARNYHDVQSKDIKLAPSMNRGVDCKTHIYSADQLKNTALSTLKRGKLVQKCVKMICWTKIEYKSRQTSYTNNDFFPLDAFYIRTRPTGGILTNRMKKTDRVVVSSNGIILGVISKAGMGWKNCPARPEFGTMSVEQEIDVEPRKTNSGARGARFDGSTSPRGMGGVQNSAQNSNVENQRSPSSPGAPGSPPKDNGVASEPSTSGSKE